MSDKPKILTPEEVSRRTGIPAQVLADAKTHIEAMLNDEALKLGLFLYFSRRSKDLIGITIRNLPVDGKP